MICVLTFVYTIVFFLLIIFDHKLIWPFSIIQNFVDKYKKFNKGFGTVRMKYDLVKKLYHVKQERWYFCEEFNGYLKKKTMCNDGKHRLEKAIGLYYEKRKGEYTHISLSMKDWISFLRDKRKFERKVDKATEKERNQKEKIQHSKELEEILAIAQKDIDEALKKAEKEITTGIQGIKNSVKGE